MGNKATLLIVDDEPNNIELLQLDLEDDYEVISANDGLQAWELLQEHKENINAILLDRMMPNMDGMEFLNKLKGDDSVADIPVIMQTAAAEKEQVIEGIKAGVYYYLTKPYDPDLMLSLVHEAIRESSQRIQVIDELKEFKHKLHLIKNSRFEIRTVEEAQYLSTFLANFFPDPEKVVLGISELMINAVEHGNLGITYEEKSKLNKEGRWLEEVSRRAELPENKDKKVLIDYVREQDAICLRIVDEGKGFDWDKYMELSPDRVVDSHGRGIAMSKMMSFDSISYIGKGNEVLCTVNL